MTWTKGNGEAHDIPTDLMTSHDKLDLILEAVRDLSARLTEIEVQNNTIIEQYDELVEKLSNVELPWGDGMALKSFRN